MEGHSFYFGVDISHLWFQGFSSRSTTDLVILCVVVGVVCTVRTCLSCVTLMFFNPRTMLERKHDQSLCLRIACHCLAVIIKIIDYSLGYLLMLAFMIGNLWICLVIILTSGLSYFLTYWSRIGASAANPGVSRLRDEDDAGEEMAFLGDPAEADEPKSNQFVAAKLPTIDQRTSVEASHLAPLATFQRDQHNYASGATDQYTPLDEQSTLLIRPDVISEEPAGARYSPVASRSDSVGARYSPVASRSDSVGTRSQTKDRSDSNPLLDKYPVLRFHNVDVPDTSRPRSGLEYDELDQLIKDLQS